MVGRSFGQIFAFWLLSFHAARAEPLRVRLFRGNDADAIVRQAATRLEAELQAAGFVVDWENTAAATDPRRALETGGAPSFASIVILRSGSEAVADVWVVDHLSNKTLVRRVDAGPVSGTERTRTLAIRAVELLRASLLELRQPAEEPGQTAPDKPTPADVAHWMAPALNSRPPLAGWSIALGAVTTSTTGVGPTIGPSAWLSRAVATGWMVGARWVGPTYGPTLRGAGAVDSEATGQAATPLQTHDVRGLSAALHASPGLHLKLAERVGLIVETGALLLVPARPVRIVGQDVGNASSWSWVSSLGLVTSFD
ncbi:MAG TPA: hypothetical protein VNO55_20600 [Polyangia bacterium]|nr:hypothetical protein [Polyangia bacterium]